jgi:DNA-binding transcriptional regulator YiaG
MRDRDDERDDDDEVAEEDVIALNAMAAMLEVEGDDELAWAQREALAALTDEAMALKARREAREERRAAERRAMKRARREEQERAVREEEARIEAARADAARRARAAQEAADARAQAQARAERQERARREQEARHEALRRQRTVEQRRAVQAPSVRPVAPPLRPMRSEEHSEARAPVPSRVRAAESRPNRADPPEAGVERHEPSKEPDRFLQDEPASLNGADLSAWRTRLGLTQQAAADRLGVRQGTVSKAESRGRSPLGPALHEALTKALRSERRTA